MAEQQATYLVDNVDALRHTLAAVRKAQAIYATYSQEQVDAIFRAAALAANRARIPLAKLAAEETGMGIVEDKVIKNHYASEYIYNAYKDAKTCGILEEDSAYGTMKIAEPIGVVAAVIPTTNPTSTAIFKILISLKTRNAIVISPHPRAKQSTIAAAKLVADAAVAAGAPEGLVAWIDVPSLELTQTLMQEADIILATGGPGMVKAAYSSGKPALGVGAGNTPAVIEESADVKLAVNSIVHSKTFDNGMICASEQSVLVTAPLYEAVKAEFTARGCHILTEEETEMARVLLEYGQEHTFTVEETPITIRRGVLGVQAAGDGFTVQLTFQKKAASATPTETQCRKLEALCVETVQRCWDAGADILSLGSVRALRDGRKTAFLTAKNACPAVQADVIFLG